MNKKIPLILVLIVIAVGAAIVVYGNGMTSENKLNSVPQNDGLNTNNESVSSSSSLASYTPVPIDRSKLLSGKFTENRSPDGNFVSHTFDNEQGDSGVYLTTTSGTEVTATYCGYFREWSPDSKEITVFVPEECGKNVSGNETFELRIDGTISK